jgi:hypothetical protein
MRRIFCLLVVISLLIMSLPFPVQAITSNLTVAGEGYQNPNPAGTYWGGATNYTNLNSDDGDTSYLGMDYAGGSKYHFWTFSACPNVPISSVTFYHKERWLADPGPGSTVDYARIGSTNYIGNVRNLNISYTLYSTTWTTNPATGLAWTKADVDSAQFGLYNNYPVDVSYAYLTITYIGSSPTVSTSAASSLGVTTATLNGSIDNTNGADCDYKGFVWDTTSHPSVTDNVTPPNGYSDNWTSAGTFTAGAFTHGLTGLTSTSVYYYRAFAHNVYGWDYGDEVTFQPIHAPTITTLAATNVATTTARLNASVTSNGGQLADVRFGYDTVTRAVFADYANITAWVSDNFSTGDTPYVDITGLTGATPYFFRVQIQNDYGTAVGSELGFTTYNSVLCPTSITAIPNASSISLSWTKGTGANMTVVRYKAGSYPTGSSDGALAYLGTGSSQLLTGLTPGTTYYFIVYGLTGGVYSASYASVLGTTTAYDSSSSTASGLIAPQTDLTFNQTPSAVKTSTIPIAGGLIQGISDSYHQPLNYVWYFVWMLAAVGVGIAVYIKGNFNIILGVGSMLGVMGIGVWWYNVIAGGVVIALGIIAIAWALVGLRRPGG